MKKRQKIECKNIFEWAWKQRKELIDPEEARYTMAEALDALKACSDPEASEKRLRDYERYGAVTPKRTQGGHRLYSVSNILSLHLMLKGTKYLGSKEQAEAIVRLYEISRRQPRRHRPTIFDYDPKLPGEKKIHRLLHEPLLKSPIQQVMQLVRVISRVDIFLHLNDFARKHGIAFKCLDSELIDVKRGGKVEKIAPPLTEWKSVRKALRWNEFYYAEAKVNDIYPLAPKAREVFDEKVNKKIIRWLLKNGYAVKLRG
jgi:DNA-binding transcriptional MerR regulator